MADRRIPGEAWVGGLDENPSGNRSSRYYQNELKARGLSEEQIDAMDLGQLHRTLELIDQLVDDPISGLNIKASPGHTEYRLAQNFKKLLLDRKTRVLDRISLLRKEQDLSEIKVLSDVLKRTPAENERLQEFLDRYAIRLGERQKEEKEDIADRAETHKEQREALQADILFAQEMKERRTKNLRSWLERESIASVLGSVLLIGLAATMIVAMFTGIEPTQIITSSFLLILGYFFGTTTTKAKSKDE